MIASSTYASAVAGGSRSRRSRLSSAAFLLALTVTLAGCKSKQDEAIEHAKQQAAATHQPQQVVTTDKSGNTVTTTVQPPQPGTSGQVVTTTVTPKPAAGAPGQPPTTDSTQTPEQQQAQAAAQGSAAAPVTAAPAAGVAPEPAAAPVAPAQVHVAAGTSLAIRINQRISAKDSTDGQQFTGDVEEAVKDSSGTVVIPRGSDVRGVVQVAKGRGDFKGAAEIKLRLTSLKLDGKEYPLDTRSVLRTKKGKGKRTAGFIGGGAGLGLLIGGLAGGGKGAAIGGLAGAGAGTAGAGLTGNRDLVIPAESVVRFKLADELSIEP